MTTQVCDQCGHVEAHDSGPVQLVPHRAIGSMKREILSVQECEHVGCHCNFAVWRDLLPTEPAL